MHTTTGTQRWLLYTVDVMPSPYAEKYANAPKLRMPKERAGREQSEGNAGLLRLLGSAAPIVGTGLGALVGGIAGGGVGAVPGAAIGGALGGAASSALGGAADEQERPYADDDMERESRRRLAMDVYGSLRR